MDESSGLAYLGSSICQGLEEQIGAQLPSLQRRHEVGFAFSGGLLDQDGADVVVEAVDMVGILRSCAQ